MGKYIWQKRLRFEWGGNMENSRKSRIHAHIEKEELYRYWFATMEGLGRKAKRRLLEKHTEQELFERKKADWKEILSVREWNSFSRYEKLFNIEETAEEYNKLAEKGISFLSEKDEKYPEKLRQMEDGPLGIFVKGKISKNKKALAIVGSRVPSVYGSEMARIFARDLAKAGVDIISGMALGIDVAAHKGALEGKGFTLGVLGCGPDVVYPRENYMIYEQMIESGGILSEYKPGEKPLAYRFPERNRIISGLSDGILIVEAKARSGSLITADCGLEQGKDIFALPGRCIDPLSEGCNWLIRQGAKMVTEPSHILEELMPDCEKILKNTNNLYKLLDNKEKIVYHCLSLEPKHIDDILRETKFTVSDGINILFRLELNGYIKQIVKDYYIIKS